jgi:plasmid maintenance system antidote protein VapI
MKNKKVLPSIHPGEISLFGSSPEMWMGLQAAYDLKKATQNKKVMQRIARIVPMKTVEEVQA